MIKKILFIIATERSWKKGLYNHKVNFNNRKFANSTSSKCLWLIKTETGKSLWLNEMFKKTQAYKGGNNSCRLRLEEKGCILE